MPKLKVLPRVIERRLSKENMSWHMDRMSEGGWSISLRSLPGVGWQCEIKQSPFMRKPVKGRQEFEHDFDQWLCVAITHDGGEPITDSFRAFELALDKLRPGVELWAEKYPSTFAPKKLTAV